MKHTMKLLSDPYKRILDGKKNIKIRLFDEKRQKLTLGDIIEFSCLENNGKIKVQIVGLLRYFSFSDLLKDFGMKNYGYAQDYSVQDFLDSIYDIYSQEKEKKYGVLGIKIEIID